MKKRILVLTLVISFISFSFILNDDGRAGRTGSPGETTCNTSQCHTGNALNAPGGFVAISSPDMPGWEYVPGQTYNIEVTVSRTGVNLYGFGFEALKSDGSNGGNFFITNPGQTHLLNAVVGSNVRTNVVHTLNGGLSPGAHTFSFQWIAPAAGVGNITFYTAANAANGNGSTSGDFIYSSSQVVTPATTSFDELSAAPFTIFPIPAIDKLYISLDRDLQGTVKLELGDLTGKVIPLKTVDALTAGALIHVDLPASVTPGIYFLRFHAETGTISQKVVISR